MKGSNVNYPQMTEEEKELLRMQVEQGKLSWGMVQSLLPMMLGNEYEWNRSINPEWAAWDNRMQGLIRRHTELEGLIRELNTIEGRRGGKHAGAVNAINELDREIANLKSRAPEKYTDSIIKLTEDQMLAKMNPLEKETYMAQKAAANRQRLAIEGKLPIPEELQKMMDADTEKTKGAMMMSGLRPGDTGYEKAMAAYGTQKALLTQQLREGEISGMNAVQGLLGGMIPSGRNAAGAALGALGGGGGGGNILQNLAQQRQGEYGARLARAQSRDQANA